MATEPVGHALPPVRSGGARHRSRSRFQERSLLLNPGSVIAAALATFMVVLLGLTARLATGRDPALAPVVAIRQPSGHAAGVSLVTRSSGGQALPGSGRQGAQGGAAATQPGSAPLVTSASGAGGLYQEDDGA